MKDWQGWLALGIFAVSCYVIGENRYLMKSMNAAALAMLGIAVVLVLLLNSRKDAKQETIEMEDEV